MKCKNIYKILTTTVILATTGCFNPSDDLYDDYQDNYYTTNEDRDRDKDKAASIHDVLTIINTRDFIRTKDAYIMYTYRLLTVDNICNQQKYQQISDSFEYISQKLNELEQGFMDFLHNNHTSSFLNESQQIREDIEQEIDQLNNNIYECIEENRISGSSLHASV